MAEIIYREEIDRILPNINLLNLMEQGFAAYSRGEVIVPPPGELLFDDPPGDMHIKYGYIRDDDYYVIKVASGFYRNPDIGLPSSQGLMLLFSRHTGVLAAILLDEGRLTDVRTAAAGAVAAKHLAPKNVECIGVVGAGIQARLQLLHLLPVTNASRALIWSPDEKEFDDYQAFFTRANKDVHIEFTKELCDIPRTCNLIVTATPSEQPLLMSADIKAGTHITAVGSDTPKKTEVESSILAQADILVVDSLDQSHSRGEVFRAVQSGKLNRERVIELGAIIENPNFSRQDDTQITLADLTGVAVQDIQIAKAVYQERLAQKDEE